MDDEEYQQLLCDFITNQDQQQQAIDILTRMSESNVLDFLELNLIVFSKFQDPTLCHVTITMIYGEVKKKTIFASAEDASTFWTNFTQIIPDSFQSEILQENSKYLISSIISYFATYFYRLSQDDQIQVYLLNLLEENPGFESYIITSIEEIVISSPNFGGFALENLMKIITMNPLQLDTSVIPRFKLYFSVILRIFKCEEDTEGLVEIKSEIIDLFPQLFESTPEPLFDKMISMISLFAEIFSEFFEPHLNAFVPLLCKLAKDPDFPFRNNVIFCIESLCKGSITMCSSLESYYVPVISSLISIISEITEESPLNENLNDLSSCIIAQNALFTFLNNCQNKAVYLYLDNFFKETITDLIGPENEESLLDLEKVPWQLLYAFIYALSFKNSALYFTSLNKTEDAENENEVEIVKEDYENCGDNIDSQILGSYYEIVVAVIPFLTDPNTPAHLKIAIYDLTSSYSKQNCRLFSRTSETNLVAILMSNVLEEENFFIQKKCILALKRYIKNGRFWLTEDDYVNIFLSISEDLPNIPLHLMSYFIHIMKYFVNDSVINLHPEVYNIYITSLITLYESNGEIGSMSNECLDLQVDIFISLIKIIQKAFKNGLCSELFESIPDLAEKIFLLLKDAIIILDSDKCVEESRLMKSIIDCITILDQDALPLIEHFNLIEHCFEESNKDINVDKFYQFDINEDDMSMMSKVQSFDEETNATGEVFYYVTNEQEEIHLFLELLLSIIRIIKSDFQVENLDSIVQVCQKWITNVYHFEKLKLTSWKLISELIVDFVSFPQSITLISCFIDDFINYFGVGSIQYNKVILDEMNNFMSFAIIDHEMMPMILEKMSNYVDGIFSEISKIYDNLANYKLTPKVVIDESKMPYSITYHQLIIESVLIFFKIALNKYTNETYAFFDQIYLEKLNIYLSKVESFEFALEIKTFFVSKVKDQEAAKQLVTTLFKLFVRCLSQISHTSSLCLAKLYSNVELPLDYVYSLVQAYQIFFQRDLTDLTEYSDLAVGTFSILIKHYDNAMLEMAPLESILSTDDASDFEFNNLYDCAIYIFINALPIWNVSVNNYDVFELIANLMEQQNKFIMDHYEFQRIWFNLISKIDDDSYMNEEISLRFKNIIREITHNEQYQDLFELVFSDFGDLQKQIWLKISEEQ